MDCQLDLLLETLKSHSKLLKKTVPVINNCMPFPFPPLLLCSSLYLQAHMIRLSLQAHESEVSWGRELFTLYYDPNLLTHTETLTVRLL